MLSNKKIEGLGALPQANIFDNIPDFTAVSHRRENNAESQKHLEENDDKFTGQCAKVFSLLLKGVVLSSYIAMTNYGIGHLPRRIKDLRDNGGIEIDESFEKTSDGKTTRNKLWFMKNRISPASKIKYKLIEK